ncbi:MAG: CPBP family intramembrane metalloprotease [Thermoguttaceae bacterium]|nr:CPBP family intramembrane metalloprotease [Thermoguttaceae bacterium]
MIQIPPKIRRFLEQSPRINPRHSGFGQEWTVLKYVIGFFRRKQVKSTFILFYAVWAVVLWAYIPQAPRLFTLDDVGNVVVNQPDCASLSPAERVIFLLLDSQQLWGAFVLFGLLPMLFVKFLFWEKLSDYGISLGKLKRVRNLVLVFVPLSIWLTWVTGENIDYFGTYPYNPMILGGHSSIAEGHSFLLIYFTLYVLLYYVSWEFFFRGFLQIGTERSVGCFNAILIGTAFSTFAHLGPHAMVETIGAIGGGILWGFFVYRTRSILPSLLMHATLGIGLDFFLLYYFL